MPGSQRSSRADEPIYHEVCEWIDVQRRSRADPWVWPAHDPDDGVQDRDRTVPVVAVPDHLFGPWEVHRQHLNEL